MTIRTSDGREVTNTVYAPTGSGLLGIDWADIDAKFRALMPLSGLPETRLAPIFDLIRDFRRQTDVEPADRIAAPGGGMRPQPTRDARKNRHNHGGHSRRDRCGGGEQYGYGGFLWLPVRTGISACSCRNAPCWPDANSLFRDTGISPRRCATT